MVDRVGFRTHRVEFNRGRDSEPCLFEPDGEPPGTREKIDRG